MNLMSVDLYQSATDPEKFLALPAGADPAGLTGPMVFDKDYAEVVRYQEGFEFDPAQSYAGVNAAKIAADLLTLKWAMYRREPSQAAGSAAGAR
jgi:hypothetical protein